MTRDEGMTPSLHTVLSEHPEQVDAWLADLPGAWGFLAGQAVLAERRRLGRSLTDGERRAVWQALWDLLTQERTRGGHQQFSDNSR